MCDITHSTPIRNYYSYKTGGGPLILVDKLSRIPVYEQIKNQIITCIRLGIYPADSRLPSIRSITSEASVNVNTVKKAFAELEAAGVIYTVPGIGSFVSKSALESEAVTAKAKRNIADAFENAKSVGVTQEEIREILFSVYGKDKND